MKIRTIKKTTITKLPMDFLEIPQPSFTRGFLELAEEARNVCVENEQCFHVDEVLPQVAGMTKPAVVTIAEYSHPSSNDGATVAPLISTKKLMPVVPAGRCPPVDQMGQAGPCDETVQSVLSGSESEYGGTDSVGPVGPYVTFDQVQQVADGPVGPYVTLSPVGSDGMNSQCDSDQPVADGPVGPSVTLGPVGPCGTLSQCNSDQPVADGPVGPFAAHGLVGPCGMFLRCDNDRPVADGLVDPYEMSLQIDINKVVTTDEPANSVGKSPSSDSGIHSLGEQWEDTSVVTTDAEEEHNRASRIYAPTQRCMINTGVPTNTEEDNVTLCPLIDCLSRKKSDE